MRADGHDDHPERKLIHERLQRGRRWGRDEMESAASNVRAARMATIRVGAQGAFREHLSPEERQQGLAMEVDGPALKRVKAGCRLDHHVQLPVAERSNLGPIQKLGFGPVERFDQVCERATDKLLPDRVQGLGDGHVRFEDLAFRIQDEDELWKHMRDGLKKPRFTRCTRNNRTPTPCRSGHFRVRRLDLAAGRLRSEPQRQAFHFDATLYLPEMLDVLVPVPALPGPSALRLHDAMTSFPCADGVR